MDIPTICQRLFYGGHELQDNNVTVATLGILANDILDLREEKEDGDLLDDSDADGPGARRRDEGPGFRGTLLFGEQMSDSAIPYEDSMSERTSTPMDVDKSCPACTFNNPANVSTCAICLTPLS